jgi:hypothetical protein
LFLSPEDIPQRDGEMLIMGLESHITELSNASQSFALPDVTMPKEPPVSSPSARRATI